MANIPPADAVSASLGFQRVPAKAVASRVTDYGTLAKSPAWSTAQSWNERAGAPVTSNTVEVTAPAGRLRPSTHPTACRRPAAEHHGEHLFPCGFTREFLEVQRPADCVADDLHLLTLGQRRWAGERVLAALVTLVEQCANRHCRDVTLVHGRGRRWRKTTARRRRSGGAAPTSCGN